MPARVLILGGTAEARELAARLTTAGHDVGTSLAGLTAAPMLPQGRVRKGGFGGSAGLATYLEAEAIDWLVDATHPFAATISVNAAAAAASTGVKLVRLERAPWQPQEGDRWNEVADTAAAVAALHVGAIALVTIGSKAVAAFAARQDVQVVARMIEAPKVQLPANWRIVLARPPFSVDDELALMGKEGITVVVSKNAGGAGTAKLEAARRLGLPVVMIARPVKPLARTIATAEDVQAWIEGESR